MLHKTAVLISLILTVPTMILAACVVALWSKSTTQSLRAGMLRSRKLSATEWFILGVATGFLGSFFDNLYWTFPWTADYLDLPQREHLMKQGVYYNIFSRQLAGILSAYCHIKSYNEYQEESSKSSLSSLSWLVTFCVTSAAASGLVLYCLRHFF